MKKVAVLFFTRKPIEDAHEKQFLSHSGERANRKISEQLFQNTLTKIEKSGIPYFIVDSAEQIGDSFGERLGNAFEKIFSDGFHSVIAVGNDAPELSSSLLRRAATALETREWVLGPDKRGGAYLIGISRNSFLIHDFISFSWKSKTLFEEMVGWASSKNFGCSILPKLADINHEWDLKSLVTQRKISGSFFYLLISVLASFIVASKKESSRIISTLSLTSLEVRGPPAC